MEEKQKDSGLDDEICKKCNFKIGKLENIYVCKKDKEFYHTKCGGLNKYERDKAKIER